MAEHALGSSGSQAAPVSSPSENATQVHASKNKVDPAKAFELGSAFTWLNGENETAPALAEHHGQHPSLPRGARHPLPTPHLDPAAGADPSPGDGHTAPLVSRTPAHAGTSRSRKLGFCQASCQDKFLWEL